MVDLETDPDEIEILRRFGRAMELLAEALDKLAADWGPKFAELHREIVVLEKRTARQRQPVMIDPRMSRGKGGKVRWRRE